MLNVGRTASYWLQMITHIGLRKKVKRKYIHKVNLRKERWYVQASQTRHQIRLNSRIAGYYDFACRHLPAPLVILYTWLLLFCVWMKQEKILSLFLELQESRCDTSALTQFIKPAAKSSTLFWSFIFICSEEAEWKSTIPWLQRALWCR